MGVNFKGCTCLLTCLEPPLPKFSVLVTNWLVIRSPSLSITNCSTVNRGPLAVYETSPLSVLTYSNVERHVGGSSFATLLPKIINLKLILEYKNDRIAHQARIRTTSTSDLLNRHYHDYLVSNSLYRLPFDSIQCFLSLFPSTIIL